MRGRHSTRAKSKEMKFRNRSSRKRLSSYRSENHTKPLLRRMKIIPPYHCNTDTTSTKSLYSNLHLLIQNSPYTSNRETCRVTIAFQNYTAITHIELFKEIEKFSRFIKIFDDTFSEVYEFTINTSQFLIRLS